MRARLSESTQAQIGVCGELRWVRSSTWFAGQTSYFDADDRLVCVEAWADHQPYCSRRSAAIRYGNRPACQRRVTMSLKDEAPRVDPFR